MKVLLLEDNNEKNRLVTELVTELGGEIEQAPDIKHLELLIKKKMYDVIIIDMVIAMHAKDYDYQNKAVFNGYSVLEYIKNTTDPIFKPKRIIVLSQFVNVNMTWDLNRYAVRAINYDRPDGNWKQELTDELKEVEMQAQVKADIAIITVVDNERFGVTQCFEKWEPVDVGGNDINEYAVCNYKDDELTLVHCHVGKMGVIATSYATSRVVELFRPDCIIMCGIAGGRKGEVHIGDIILAESSIDYASGAIEENGEDIHFLPDPDMIPINNTITKIFKKYKQDRDLLLDIRKKSDPLENYDQDIRLQIGKMATGPAVIKSEKFTQKYIKEHHRKYLGIDMESYGMYYAANNSGCDFFTLKAVSDDANSQKKDTDQKYAALLAANLVKHYINNDYMPKGI